MKAYVLRLNPDTRSGKPYSAYPSASEYKSIHAASPMDGFHEAVNFLQEGGTVRGYLPPKHSASLRDGEPFALITITAKTAHSHADLLVGFQIGCIYEGEQERTSTPKSARGLGFHWHFSCPASTSLLLANPLLDARSIVLEAGQTWLRGPTKEIGRKQFLKCLTRAESSATTAKEKSELRALREAFESKTLAPRLETLDSEDFQNAVVEAYKKSGPAPKGNLSPKQVRTSSYQFVRDPAVVAHALKVAKGICSDCKKPAPFKSEKTGLPYLEVHHVKTLASGGEDTIQKVVALCPNCHRKRHHGTPEA